MISFSHILPQEDGTVHVLASLYFANLGATGKTYVLLRSMVPGRSPVPQE